MKTHRTPRRRALAALVPLTLMAAPAFAQDAQTVTPPPVVSTAPPAVQPAPTAQVVTPPRIVPTLPAAPAEEVATAPAAAAPAARRAPRRTASPVRPVAATQVVPPAVVEPAPSPVAEAPVAEAVAPVTPSPAPQAETPVETSPAQARSTPVWPWIVGGLLAMAVIGFFMLRRRRGLEEDYADAVYEDEAIYAEPVTPTAVTEREPQFLQPAAILQPAAMAPAAAVPVFVPTATQEVQATSDKAVVATPDAGELDALTSAEAPVGDRPWLEFALRPLRAGTSVDEAMVEIELTIGNSGSVAATDVRVSTFMFASGPGDATGMERDLIDRADANSVAPITIAPGEGTRVDATLALPKEELVARDAGTFSPVVVADARYTLPDGNEGRTSASFRIGISDADGAAMTPFMIEGRSMRNDIEAELYGTPEHA